MAAFFCYHRITKVLRMFCLASIARINTRIKSVTSYVSYISLHFYQCIPYVIKLTDARTDLIIGRLLDTLTSLKVKVKFQYFVKLLTLWKYPVLVESSRPLLKSPSKFYFYVSIIGRPPFLLIQNNFHTFHVNGMSFGRF